MLTIRECKNGCTSNRLRILGSVIIVFGVVILVVWKTLFISLLKSHLALSNDSNPEILDAWTSDKVPAYFSVHLFNWTNPRPTLSKTERPNFDETGPYVFRIRQFKDRLVWNENDTLTYRRRNRWDFVPELSKGSLYDRITNINVVAVAFANKYRDFPSAFKFLPNVAIQYLEGSLYVTKTVKEWLFDGYEDRMLRITGSFKKYFPSLRQLPDRFGWYYGKNMTEYYTFNMYTGKSDINRLGLLHSSNYHTHCNVYTSSCDEVRGTMGDLWPMNSTKGNDIFFFFPDICSSFRFQNVGSTFVNDVEGIKYAGTENTFDNGTKVEENRCYCPKNECKIKSGVRDLSPFVKAPVFISFPHFYKADRSYLTAIDGMNPDPKKHTSYMILQKDSSVVLDISIKIQMNIFVEPVRGFHFFKKIPKAYFPIFWVEVYGDMTPDVIDKLKLTFKTIPNSFVIFGIILLLLGASFVLTTFFLSNRLNEIITNI